MCRLGMGSLHVSGETGEGGFTRWEFFSSLSKQPAGGQTGTVTGRASQTSWEKRGWRGRGAVGPGGLSPPPQHHPGSLCALWTC